MKNILTKSMFKTGLTCPRQLSYSLSKDYANNNIDDPFLQALAKGGFQVGALANQYEINKGVKTHHITQDNKELALKITNDLISKNENIIIFEAAIFYKGAFARIDILRKNGNHIEIIEVKSKSMKKHFFDNLLNDDIREEFLSRGRRSNGYEGIFNAPKAFKAEPYFLIKKEYEEYVYDIAFQAWIAENSIDKKYSLDFYLCTPSQELTANREGLNQKFLIKENKGKQEVIIRGKVNENALGNKVLEYHKVTEIVHGIHNNEVKNIHNFDSFINSLIEIVQNVNDGVKNISSACKSCPFNKNEIGKINGFNQCMSEETGYDITEFENKKTVFDVWNFPQACSYVTREDKPVVFMEDLEANDSYEKITTPLTYSERKNIQIRKEQMGDVEEFLNKKGIKKELDSFTYPLHFIDFETAMTAIPYRKNQSPYQMIFFQFSHHILEEDGSIRHAGQFIHLEPFKNPNVEATRALMRQLSYDNGTIFRWSMHENTVLKKVAREIEEMDYEDCPDKDELLSFIDDVTVGGEREMVDQWELYKRYHYLPETNGSNSIKHVLPAVMENFEPLEKFLSNPVYGQGRIVESLNFKKISWMKRDENGKMIDPYKRLPKVFKDYDSEQLDLIYGDQELKNGGAAMTAYAVCQFTQISMGERTRLEQALLRYCELDTFAMVMIHLYWEYKLGIFDSFGVEEEYEEECSEEIVLV
jgi:hypothetical protein